MHGKKLTEKIKKSIAGFLIFCLVLSGIPLSIANAAQEPVEQTLPSEEEEDGIEEDNAEEDSVEAEDPNAAEETETSEETGSLEENEGDHADPDTPAEDEDDPDLPPEPSQNVPAEEETLPNEELPSDTTYNVQISGNDISGNDLSTYEEETEPDGGERVVGGYIELPEEREISVVDESIPIEDEDDGIALLMEEVSLPEKYEPEVGSLPETRSQNPYGSCWAHAAMALAEIDMIRNGNNSPTVDYSELHLAYFSYSGTVKDPLGGLDGDKNTGMGSNFLNRGGNLILAQNVLTSWVGAADESKAPYSQAGDVLENGLSSELAFDDVVHLQNYYNVNMRENRDVAKQLILQYGGLGTAYFDASNNESYYNAENNCYYYDTERTTNHAVTIVGWDDTFSASNFSIRPENDGAWLIRNSWLAGADADSRNLNTYFWMSYEDKTLSAGYAFDFEDANTYQHNYQYDGGMHTGSKTISDSAVRIANVFTAKANAGGERLEAVGIGIAKAQTPYTVSIYKNLQDLGNPESGELIEEAVTSGRSYCEGFYTVPLTNPVDLASGDTFAVVVDLAAVQDADTVAVAYERPISSSTWYSCETTAEAGQSFYKTGGTWTDFGTQNKGNLRIKAYTVDDNGGSSDLPNGLLLAEELQGGSIEVGLGDSWRASCTVLPRTAKNRKVIWESADPSIAAVEENGLITGIAAGTTTITVTSAADSSVKTSFLVIVFADLRSIAIKGNASVEVGKTNSLQAVLTPSGATAASIVWSSSDQKVVTVDENGVVTGIAPGYASITATVTASGETLTTSKTITCEWPDFNFTCYISAKGFRIEWPGNAGEKSYRLYRVVGSVWSEETKKLLTEVQGDGSQTYSYLDEDVEGGKQYIYQVEATVTYIKGSGTEENIKSTSRKRYTMTYYTITYHLNAEDAANSTKNPAKYRTGVNTALYNATRPGYAFTGWYLDENLTQRIEQITQDITGNIDLYAAWELLMSLENAQMSLHMEKFSYTGSELKPPVSVVFHGTVLTENQDYTLSYTNNKNAGTATVTAVGIDRYDGSISHTFSIVPAEMRIMAKDKTIALADGTPKEYEYEVSGLLADDRMLTPPRFTCSVTETDPIKPGRYAIIPSAADAGPNYTITYEEGLLTVHSEYVAYKVTFDVQGHGETPAELYDVKAGSTIDEPEEPSADEGYQFDGWYQDATCTKEWRFDTDVVHSNITLYAKWLKTGAADGGFMMQEIEDVYYYTGKAWKPAVSIYEYDKASKTLLMLKAGRDYTIKYFNNINANKDGVLTKGNGQGSAFNPDLPYIQITGKGNYVDEIKVNFDIHPAVIGDGSDTPADKVTLKYTDQFATAKKALKPFSSIKYVKGMKKDKDYALSLTAKNALDDKGSPVPAGKVFDNAAIPANYEGEFVLTVTGIGNYTGSICKEIQVADKLHLMKNAKITLGKNQKSWVFTGSDISLSPSLSDSADTFTVKFGKTVLDPERDYTISYRNNDKVGKAELIITGTGAYVGTKTASFQIKGKPFTAKKVSVSGITDKVYTGKAITQNDAVLVYGSGTAEEKKLKYGTDYTVSYSKNINKGTATITFTGLAAKGFSGSFKKSFRILPAQITDVNQAEGMEAISVSYSKAGAKPTSEIVLTNAQGIKLLAGKDYTLKYKNNKTLAKATDEKAPTITVKGKGNYQGSFDIPFTITKADLKSKLANGDIVIKTTAMAYQKNKADHFAYKPAVKILEGKTALRAGIDYKITYLNNIQADYEAYIADTNNSLPAPTALITVTPDSNYMIAAAENSTSSEIEVPLTIYRNKLTKANLTVTIPEVIYGEQIEPSEIKVIYQDNEGLHTLFLNKDYTVSYGTNMKAGKNTGSVTISGIGMYYGGSVTVKFDIQKKELKY